MGFDALPSLDQIAVALPTVALAYVIFGIAGFGTALIAAPVLAHAMPVAAIVPTLALLDCAAAIVNGLRIGDKVARDELFSLVPLMVAGSLVGAWLLMIVPPRPMMLALGLFVVAYAVYALLARPPQGRLSRGWVLPFGGIGGIVSAMFGSGGFIYAIYLGRRLADKDAIRATQSALIGLSTLTRASIFALAGLYTDGRLLVLAVLLVPGMLLGTWAGHHVTLRLTRDQFLRIIYVILIASGATLVLRATAAG
ncbi:sulfite exporter TauE/SafE family protein [Rhodoplanes sp. TEM]|uniref:Probable membrane transporter protein n=1 Tax=Rhodoplanes tepidamans TaxID=200616 RepID=A0ABT5JB68_RHOTP|nr:MULTISPECIES: sulfite exporter TauE/SafE family protein [Rhodoplanes]MDC7786884.1 sulfite exporter TauE/SafE family protein [Rhodoplanes tepidamans]MDC7984187.1 sulfite exporter TauE/SafE family protein [Rhodoplanes sp. TEM]MDQ0356012.1 putative membrane protein YfcA [Rhodoplanes tepidamans]